MAAQGQAYLPSKWQSWCPGRQHPVWHRVWQTEGWGPGKTGQTGKALSYLSNEDNDDGVLLLLLREL